MSGQIGQAESFFVRAYLDPLNAFQAFMLFILSRLDVLFDSAVSYGQYVDEVELRQRKLSLIERALIPRSSCT